VSVSLATRLWAVEQVLRMHQPRVWRPLPVHAYWPTRHDRPPAEQVTVGCAQCPADGSACPLVAQALTMQRDIGLRRVA